MASKLGKVEISFDGVTYTDVSTYVRGVNYKGILNNQADILKVKFLKSLSTHYTIREWLNIRYSEGWVTSTDRRPFKGVITRVKSEYDYINIDAADDIYKFLKSEKTSVYNKDTDPQAGVISAIAEDMMDEVVPTNVENSGTSNVLDQFVTSYKTNILERITVLAKILDYIILFDPEQGTDGEAYFVSKTYFTNARPLVIPDDVMIRPKWDSDSTQLFNDLKFIGGTSSGVRTKLFSGNGVLLVFDVDLTPTDSVKVEELIATVWTEQVQGTPGVSATYDYSIDKFNKQIVYKAGNAPANASNNVRITISAQIPPIVHLMDNTSIALYNTGYDLDGNIVGIKKTIIEDDVKSNIDAVVRATKLLSLYSQPFLSTSLTLKPEVDAVSNYKLGDTIQVTDPGQGFVSKEFVITEIERSYPGNGATLTLGDKLYRLGTDVSEIKKRLDQLEANLSGDYEILADFRSVSHENEFFRKTLVITSDSIVGENLIWDHPVYGLWDIQKWSPDSNASTGGFVLGHPLYGVLGTNKLGASTNNQIILTNVDYE